MYQSNPLGDKNATFQATILKTQVQQTFTETSHHQQFQNTKCRIPQIVKTNLSNKTQNLFSYQTPTQELKYSP